MDEFDFTVCMAAYDIAAKELYMHDDFIKYNAQKRLVFNPKTKYPIASLVRLRKYVGKYGYQMAGTEYIKMGLSINKVEINSYADLKEQLLGIDTLFLEELTSKLDDSSMSMKKYNFDEFMHILEDHLNNSYSDFVFDDDIENEDIFSS